MINYDHKPAKIRNVQDLIDFVKGIPEKFWCTYSLEQRNPENGVLCRCVMGHLGAAYEGNIDTGWKHTDGVDVWRLVDANNGYANSQVESTFGDPVIKNRVLTFLKSLL